MILNLNLFEDRHKGETCYILGDGPSLKEFDYNALKGYPSICCGMQAFHKDFNKINVKYYSLVEPYLFYPDWMIVSKKLQYLKEHRKITNEFRKIISTKKNITFFLNLSNFLAIRKKNVAFAHRYLLKKNAKFIKFFEQEIDPFGGSFSATLSVALLLGFKKVYLLGFDAFTIKQSRQRWYEKTTDQEIRLFDNIHHEFLDLYKEEMEILNISSEGTMCNLKNEDYFRHTGSKPEFRENHELIAKESLELLKERFLNA